MKECSIRLLHQRQDEMAAFIREQTRRDDKKILVSKGWMESDSLQEKEMTNSLYLLYVLLSLSSQANDD